MKPRSFIAALVVAGAASCVLAGGACAAGTYQVLYANGAGCGLFTASPSTGYGATVCGASQMSIALSALSVPGGSEENISTTAPAGVAITGATSAYSTSNSVGADGWGAGDFYTGGGLSWNPTPTGAGGQITGRGPGRLTRARWVQICHDRLYDV